MNSPETRYVVRVGNSGRHKPTDHSELLAQIRQRVEPLQGKVANLRVSRLALEFDLFIAANTELHPFLGALESQGSILSYKHLNPQAPVPPPPAILAEARQLFKEERYWEAHEVLEGLWMKLRGREKELVQGWILVAAALVHAQRNEPNVVFPMLEEAVQRLENQPASYLGVDVAKFLRDLKKAIQTKTVYFPSI